MPHFKCRWQEKRFGFFFFGKIILFKNRTQTPKPNVCSYQKHPIKDTDFFFWAGVYVAWNRTLAKPHAHFYHQVVQFLYWVTAPCTLPSIKLSFRSPCVWLFVTKKTAQLKKKKGGDCSQQLRLRQERLLRKAAKTTSKTKVSHRKKENVNGLVVKLPSLGRNHC